MKIYCNEPLSYLGSKFIPQVTDVAYVIGTAGVRGTAVPRRSFFTHVTVARRSHPNKQVGGASCALSLCPCMTPSGATYAATTLPPLVWAHSSQPPHVPTIATIILPPHIPDEWQGSTEKNVPPSLSLLSGFRDKKKHTFRPPLQLHIAPRCRTVPPARSPPNVMNRYLGSL